MSSHTCRGAGLVTCHQSESHSLRLRGSFQVESTPSSTASLRQWSFSNGMCHPHQYNSESGPRKIHHIEAGARIELLATAGAKIVHDTDVVPGLNEGDDHVRANEPRAASYEDFHIRKISFQENRFTLRAHGRATSIFYTLLRVSRNRQRPRRYPSGPLSRPRRSRPVSSLGYRADGSLTMDESDRRA